MTAAAAASSLENEWLLRRAENSEVEYCDVETN